MKTIRLFLTIVAVTVLSGCIATGAKFKEHTLQNNQQAVVYVYRPSQWNYSVIPAQFTINDQTFILENGQYYPIVLEPGTYTVKQEWKSDFWSRDTFDKQPIYLEITVGPNQSKYIKLGSDIETRYPSEDTKQNIYVWALLDKVPLIGEKEIKDCRLSDG